MGSVVVVPQWGQSGVSVASVRANMVSLDQFIRSKVEPPPLGSIVFNFDGGKVVVTGDTTQITGDEFEAMVEGDQVEMVGCLIAANAMFCAIHREIEEIKSRCAARAASSQGR